MPGALFHDRCKWPSIMPGMSVAPIPSMTVAAPLDDEPLSDVAPRVMRLMRLPCTNTSPLYGYSPVASKMRTLVNKVLSALLPLHLVLSSIVGLR